MTLYLKYRPQTIDDLDSEKVRNQLKALVDSNRLSHAFLFSGPKGTGKTSTARILAKVINCEKNKEKLGEPCNECDYCKSIVKGSSFDVIEMDAASNRGIDDIRSLKEKIVLSPGSARKKIYIIDEVHMLTTEAFNALLKTLEEPPAHVVFILATTDPHKLPDTVRSRLTNINFEKAKEGEIVHQLQKAAKGEGVKVGDDVLLLIAKVADGAFRDAVKTFEELIINVRDLKLEAVEEYLFKNKLLDSKKLLTLVSDKKLKEAISSIEEYSANGGSIKNLITGMADDLHNLLLGKLGIKDTEDHEYDFTVKQIQDLASLLNQVNVEVNNSPIAQLPLELMLVKFLKEFSIEESLDNKKKELETPPPPIKKVESAPDKKVPTKVAVEDVDEKAPIEDKADNLPDVKSFDDTQWFKVLQLVRSKNTSIEAFLRAAKPFGLDEEGLVIGVYYRFHKEQLETVNNKRIIEDSLSEVFGSHIKIKFVITERADAKPSIVSNISTPSLTTSKQQDIIDVAKEIFGN